MKCPACNLNQSKYRKGNKGTVWSASKGVIPCKKCMGTGHITANKHGKK